MGTIEEMKTSGEFVIKHLTDEKTGEEFTRGYLKAGFLLSAVDDLFYARRYAELTQEQVAEKMGKRQEVISRWEADSDGRLSLRNYADFALALDRVPYITLKPLGWAKEDEIAELQGHQKLELTIEKDGDEWLVSEPHYHIHAAAPTRQKAINAFYRICAGELECLSADEEKLGLHLYHELLYLRRLRETGLI